LDEYQQVDGPKAYELFLEGYNSQLISGSTFDFRDCLATFYDDDLGKLESFLGQIHRDYQAETPEAAHALVNNLKNINNLFLAAGKGCSQIIKPDKVKQINSIIDRSKVDFTPSNKTIGIMTPHIKLVSEGIEVDISD
jgi:hypothetical protein